jgi:hypothetical protein
MKQKIVIEIICFLLALLFAYAAFSKLIVYQEFKAQLGSLPFIKIISPALAWVLPSLELVISTVLTVNLTRLFGFVCALVLLTGISAYILLMLISDERLPCSCGGVLQQLSWKQHLIFNLFFLLLAVVGIVLESNPKKSIIH